MSRIDVELPDAAIEAVDRAVAAGRFPDRAAALEEAVQRLLESVDIADMYERAYAEHPEDGKYGLAGLGLLADRVRAEIAATSSTPTFPRWAGTPSSW